MQSVDVNNSTNDAPEQLLLGADFDQPFVSPGPFSWSIRLLILLLGTMSALGPLAIDMYLPAFQTIGAEFHVSVAEVERTLAVYFVGIAIGQLIYGPASDRFGRKRPLYVGLITFVLASAGCALSRNVHQLMVMRALQALGGCAEMVIARAIVRDRFDPRQATRVFSALLLVMGLAPILAPLIGAALVVHLGWRAIFELHVIVGAVCLLNVFFFLSESLPAESRNSPSVRETALNYLLVLKHRAFMINTLSVSLISGGLFAYVGGCSFVLIQLFHVAPQHFGFFFGINAAGLITASQINGRLAYRYPLHLILRFALIAAAISGTILVFDAARHGSFASILIPLFFFVATLGFVFPTATALAMAPFGRNAGNASAVLGCMQFLISGISGMLVSLLDNGTAMPMCGLIAAGAVLALAVNLLSLADEPATLAAPILGEGH